MSGRRRFIVGRIVRRNTTLYMPRGAPCPIRGPWVLRAVVSRN
jgi:hypothetical protein